MRHSIRYSRETPSAWLNIPKVMNDGSLGKYIYQFANEIQDAFEIDREIAYTRLVNRNLSQNVFQYQIIFENAYTSLKFITECNGKIMNVFDENNKQSYKNKRGITYNHFDKLMVLAEVFNEYSANIYIWMTVNGKQYKVNEIRK